MVRMDQRSIQAGKETRLVTTQIFIQIRNSDSMTKIDSSGYKIQLATPLHLFNHKQSTYNLK